MIQQIQSTCVPIEYLVMGPIENNVYIVDDGTSCFIVDPTCEPDLILEALGERQLDAILITHGHWDHTGAAAALREKTGAPVIASEADTPFITGEGGEERHRHLNTPCQVDKTVAHGDIVELGNMKWRVIATPGHTPGGLCYYLEPESDGTGAPVLLSGDTLFAGTYGRVDFPESDALDMRDSLKTLAQLPPETIVLPGHKGFSTIGRERVWIEKIAD